MKAVVASFNQEKALVGAFSEITNLRMELFQAPQATEIIGRVNEVSMVCRLGAKNAAATRHHEQLTSGGVLAMIHDGLVIFIMVDAGYRN